MWENWWIWYLHLWAQHLLWTDDWDHVINMFCILCKDSNWKPSSEPKQLRFKIIESHYSLWDARNSGNLLSTNSKNSITEFFKRAQPSNITLPQIFEFNFKHFKKIKRQRLRLNDYMLCCYFCENYNRFDLMFVWKLFVQLFFFIKFKIKIIKQDYYHLSVINWSEKLLKFKK
jgi:hypothetical protein